MTKRIANLYVCPICGDYETVGTTGPKPLCAKCSDKCKGDRVVWMELVRGPEEELYTEIYYGHQEKYPATKGSVKCRRNERNGMKVMDFILFGEYKGSYLIPLK